MTTKGYTKATEKERPDTWKTSFSSDTPSKEARINFIFVSLLRPPFAANFAINNA